MTECWVCMEELDTDDAHTFHAPRCPLRQVQPCHAEHLTCARMRGCGEDVHDSCCPTCTGQEF
jgi:hypothetical protein